MPQAAALLPDLPTSFARLVSEQRGASFRSAVKVESAPMETVLPGQGEVGKGVM